VPIPWGGSRAPYAFGPGADQPWIPQPDDWAPLTVAAQSTDPASTLAFYTDALRLRRDFAWTAGEDVSMLDLGDDVVAFTRGPVTVVLNCGTVPVELPAGELVLASGPVDGTLPPDTAAWLR
jgi:alpha-glucosidase